MSHSAPLVSVITPVYNGEAFLAECVESVLAQTYENWEYTIVNNCSNDGTLQRAQYYANKDRRVRVVSNSRFVDAIENHNIAFRLISTESKYCKLISADDWIYPECISKLVDLSERNDTVGIVGAYSIHGDEIKHPRLPHHSSVFNGRQVCRNFLLGSIDVFGSPTTVLYRSSLVRAFDPFFPGPGPSADMAACLICLESCDFGFVHQILSFERVHDEAVSAKLLELNSFFVDRLEFVVEYGPRYLTQSESEERISDLLSAYYDYLAAAVFRRPRTEAFWTYHRERLERLGYHLYGTRLATAIGMKSMDLLCNPKQTFEKALRRLIAKPRAGRRPWS